MRGFARIHIPDQLAGTCGLILAGKRKHMANRKKRLLKNAHTFALFFYCRDEELFSKQPVSFCMATHIVKIMSISRVTHDVLRIVTAKPPQFTFSPGQATEISINKSHWNHEKRPFTITSLPSENHLEFIIKTYPSHHGVTNELLDLYPGDELLLNEVFGTIAYRGPGLFIAGGAGVTPFISIFRHLRSKGQLQGNTLLCANKTKRDIILEDELREALGQEFINVLSDEKAAGYHHGRIGEELLAKVIGRGVRRVYLCGPPPMMNAVEEHLVSLKVDRYSIIKENF